MINKLPHPPELSASPPRATNTTVIARNSFWYTGETVFGLVAGLLTSILIARAFGPERLGYFSYVSLLTTMSGVLGSLGIPNTTRKYMAEYLGRGEEQMARGIYGMTLRIQTIVALSMVLCGLGLVFTVGDPQYRTFSALLVLGMAPRMIAFIPSQANTAAETLGANMPGSMASVGLTLAGALLSIHYGWGLTGIAAGMLIAYSLELVLKVISVRRRLAGATGVPVPPELRKRMFAFSGQSIFLMLLVVIVWDRSDVLVLKWLNPDIRQVAFFSIAFGLGDKIVMLPQAFGHALGATMMAQFGRDRSRLYRMSAVSMKYMLLFGLPMLLGGAALSDRLIQAVYGAQYLPVIPVFALAAALAISKCVAGPASQLLQATENQSFLVWWGTVCAAVNVLLDILLTPGYGATGAAIANGSAQTLMAIGVWTRVVRLFQLEIEVAPLAKILVSALVMVIAVRLAVLRLESWLALAAGVAAGAVVFLPMLRLTGALEPDDRQRMAQIGRAIPGRARVWFEAVVDFLAPVKPLVREPLP
jgi:O-antigen/teichoic acid export membrane protein